MISVVSYGRKNIIFYEKRCKTYEKSCVAQLVRAVDRQSKVPGSNPDPVKIVSFPQKDFKFFKFE